MALSLSNGKDLLPGGEDDMESLRLMDIAADASEREGVRQGDADTVAGRTRPAKTVFSEMRKTHGLSR